ncbi:MAG: polysaccharide biosynthesis protein [Acidobacteria bacterium]|nr:polysaccharide biosynthesis protein [Acidobacteriota bacterium]
MMTLRQVMTPTPWKRRFGFLAGDLVLIAGAFTLSFLLRFDFHLPPDFSFFASRWLPLFALVQVVLLRRFGLYRCAWSYVGLKEMAGLLTAAALWTAVFFAVVQGAQWTATLRVPPRSVVLLHGVFSALLIAAYRIARRVWREVLRERHSGQRALIIGAGPTGERLARELLRDPDSVFHPVAFVDDDPVKDQAFIHGVPVAGTLAEIPSVVKAFDVEAAVMAITSAKHTLVQGLWDTLTACGVRTLKVVPPIARLPEQSVSVRDLHDLNIEDLLYREPVETDATAIRGFLAGKRVLVTGAAGSIGSEITRQLLRHGPAAVIVFDVDETGVYDRLAELNRLRPPELAVHPFVGDVRKPRSVDAVFRAHRPQVVFHAAAYKHVPMMEAFPEEALETNAGGTHTLGRAALVHGVERFVNISTDKAVNPTSVMGASKRLAEAVCSTLNALDGTRFVSVRFGNVLASRGSVVPLFLDQIRRGGPVTVTHPEMSRYFMTIPEAVNLVFQAAAMGAGGEVFVLDMGEPVKILKLAEDLIRLNGMEPREDIPIAFTGLRPGEKLFEELLTAEEGTVSTSHAKVFVARQPSRFSGAELEAMLREMADAVAGGAEAIRAFLAKNVPFYRGGGGAG